MKKFDTLLEKLADLSKSGTIKCKDFTKLLEDLGFEIKKHGSSGHRAAKHPAVSYSQGVGFNCGHNPGTEVKRAYIKHIYKFAEKNKDVIKEYLK